MPLARSSSSNLDQNPEDPFLVPLLTIAPSTADADGQPSGNGRPVPFTQHDFRRQFATALIGAGLPRTRTYLLDFGR